MKRNLIFAPLACIALLAAAPVVQATPGFIDLYDFTANPGLASGVGSLMKASDGYFYGLTYTGGSTGFGTIYKLTITGTRTAPVVTYTLLHTFLDSEGRYPGGPLVEGYNGHLYGTTQHGPHVGTNIAPGAIFQYNRTSGVFTIIHVFGDGSIPNDGSWPKASVAVAPSGTIYATTSYGGTGGGVGGGGTLIRLAPILPSGSGWTKTLLYSFANESSPMGYDPSAQLLVASDGNVYGTTRLGGATGAGIAFKFNTTTGTLSKIMDMPGTNSNVNRGGLTQDPSFVCIQACLTLWGMMSHGGVNGKGVVYKLTDAGSGVFTYTAVHNFTGGTSDGAYPRGKLAFSLGGSTGFPAYSFLGETPQGGTSNKGVIFSASISGPYSIQYNLPDASYEGPILTMIGSSASETMYMGSSMQNGANGYGYVWEYHP